MLWVQSPTGMPTTHGSCIWIRRQESDLRGLRSERSWDASNPHLNNWRASKELHPTSGIWKPVPRYEDRPNMAERGDPPGPCRTHAPEWRKADRTMTMPQWAQHAFEAAPAPWLVHLPMLAEAERVERSRPLRIIVGFKPTKHAACEPLCWWRVVSPSHTPRRVRSV